MLRPPRGRPATIHAWQRVRQAATSRPFGLLIATYLIQLAGLGCFSGALPYYAVHIRQGSGVTVTLLFVALNVSAIAAMPVWTRVSRRIGKGSAYREAGIEMKLFRLTARGLLKKPE